jgi:hypothetical protein
MEKAGRWGGIKGRGWKLTYERWKEVRDRGLKE